MIYTQKEKYTEVYLFLISFVLYTFIGTHIYTVIHLECVYRKNIRSQQLQCSLTRQRVTTTNDIITHTEKKNQAIHMRTGGM